MSQRVRDYLALARCRATLLAAGLDRAPEWDEVTRQLRELEREIVLAGEADELKRRLGALAAEG